MQVLKWCWRHKAITWFAGWMSSVFWPNASFETAKFAGTMIAIGWSIMWVSSLFQKFVNWLRPPVEKNG